MKTQIKQPLANNSAMEKLALSVKKPSTNGNTAMEKLALSTKNINQPPRREKLFDPEVLEREWLKEDQKKLNKFLDLLWINDYPDISTCNKGGIVKVPVNQKKPQIILLNCDHDYLDLLPVKPTLVVQFKEKITCFWVLNKPCHKKDYKKIVDKLVLYFDGTKRFKKSEITVYVPGFSRKFKHDKEPIPVTILENSGITYDYDKLLEEIKKYGLIPVVQVGIDAEWQGNDFISLQASIDKEQNYILFNKAIVDAKEGLEEKIEKICYNEGIKPIFVIYNDSTCLLGKVFSEAQLDYISNVDLIMFYSPKDLEYAIGWDNIKERYTRKEKKGKITQRRNFKGWELFFQKCSGFLTIRDLKGWANSSLKEFCKGLGINMDNKDKLDDYKKTMITALYEHTELYIKYAMDDAKTLIDAYNIYMETIKDVSKNVLGVNIDDRDDLPMTTGSLVNLLFEEALELDFRNNSEGWYLAFRKHGILETNTRKIRELKHKVDYGTATEDELEEYIEDAKFEYLAYQQASVQYLGKIQDSRAYSAIVMGGRCHNAQPWDYRVENGADIDLKSCYGSALAKLTYPVGLPTVLGFTANQKRITLKEFLKKFESELVDDLWTITVNGTLPKSRQDLIYSKIVEQKEINKAMLNPVDSKSDGDISKIPGHFGIAQKEIKNGIITSDVLKIIRQVGNSKEINEFMNLEVQSAVFYKASDQVDSNQEWVDVIKNDKGELIIDGNNVLDTRSRAWYGYSLEKFVGKLVKKRNELKAEAKATGDNSKKAFQNILKTIQNTLYGDLVSPFFLNSNVVVGNVITAKARVGSWMVEKSLNCRQIITDGGFYTPSKVCWIKPGAKLPSLSTFADMEHWLDKKNYHRKYVPMGGKAWDQVFENLEHLDNKQLAKDFDELAITHINNFWKPYELSLMYEVEHKEEHFFHVAGYWNKGHYCFKKYFEDELQFKVRGHKQYSSDPELKRNPMYDLLENIVNYIDEFPEDLTYQKSSLLTLTKWLQAQNSNGFEYLDGKRPGDNVIEYRETTRFNDNHTHNQTIKDLERKANRKTIKASKNVPFFERFAHEGISGVHKRVISGKLK